MKVAFSRGNQDNLCRFFNNRHHEIHHGRHWKCDGGENSMTRCLTRNDDHNCRGSSPEFRHSKFGCMGFSDGKYSDKGLSRGWMKHHHGPRHHWKPHNQNSHHHHHQGPHGHHGPHKHHGHYHHGPEEYQGPHHHHHHHGPHHHRGHQIHHNHHQHFGQEGFGGRSPCKH